MGRHVYAKTGRRGRNVSHPRRIVPLPVAAAPARMLYGDYLYNEWLPAIEVEVEPTTFHSNRSSINNYIAPALGQVPVADINQPMLRGFYAELLKTPWRRSPNRLLSRSTVQRIHLTVSWSLQALVEAGRLPANPAWTAGPWIKRADRYEPVTWTPDQVRDFLTFTKDDDLAALWNLLALTGMRRGEALGLRWFDLSHRYTHVAVKRSLVQLGSTAYITAPKNSKGRRVDLLRATAVSLRTHRTRQNRRRAKAGLPEVQPGDAIFTRDSGESLNPAAVTKRFVTLGRDGGFTRIRLHDLRHTHASHLLQAGANLKAVQERLGHSDPLTTIDIYIHMMPTIQADAVRALAHFYADVGGTGAKR